jgi:hypothetical protein
MNHRGHVITWGLLAVAAGGAVLAYLLLYVSPFLPGGEINSAAIILFFAALMILTFGVSSLIAMPLHRRWPALAGVRSRREQPQPSVAARQGLLVALGIGIIAGFAFWKILDITFLIVTMVLVGLVEAFFQNRRR